MMERECQQNDSLVTPGAGLLVGSRLVLHSSAPLYAALPPLDALCSRPLRAPPVSCLPLLLLMELRPAGLSYFKPSLPKRPVDRCNNDGNWSKGSGQGCYAHFHPETFDRAASEVLLAIGKTVILLRLPPPLVGVSTVMERERLQNDSLVNG